MAMPWFDADWPAPPGVRALTTCRFGAGISPPPFDQFNLGNCQSPDGDSPANVAHNRAELIRLAALPAAPRWLRQVHGTAVARFADAQAHEEIPEADAAVTDRPGVVLAILTADCLPLVLAARDGSEVAAAHAGWRGLAAGVIEATVTAMHTPAENLRVWLGPAAGPRVYEVGREVHEAFTRHDATAANAFVATRPGHWRVDLYALARQRLHALGVAPAAIHGGNRCTLSEPEQFFSHRRDGQSGRIATLVWRQA